MRTCAILLAAAVAAGGCASKKYVGQEVGEINKKVEGLSAQVEKTQERVQRNEQSIADVDKRSQAGIADARGSAAAAMTRAGEAEKAAEKAAKGKLIYTVTLSNDRVTFPLNTALLSPEAKALVDEAVAPLKAANRGVFFEIEGHTDATGEAAYNHNLGLERASAVRDYIYGQHGIALNRIEVISFGETQPVADNKTRESRARNRRVVIKVLE